MRSHRPATLASADPVRRTGASVATALFLTVAAIGAALADRDPADGGREALRDMVELPPAVAQNVAPGGDVNAYRRLLPPAPLPGDPWTVLVPGEQAGPAPLGKGKV